LRGGGGVGRGNTPPSTKKRHLNLLRGRLISGVAPGKRKFNSMGKTKRKI